MSWISKSIVRSLTLLKDGGLRSLFRSLRRHQEFRRYALDSKSLIARFTPTKSELEEMSGRSFATEHLISVVIPVFNPPAGFLQLAVESVRKQVYPNWQLVLVDDASTDSWVRPYLREIAESDERIVVFFSEENGHIARASNAGAALAKGEFLAFLDQDDELAPHALYSVMNAVENIPQAELLYSNEDKINAAGERSEPTLKPAWSREYLLSFMYLGHLMVYRRSLLEGLGGFRDSFTGAQDFDLALRATEKTEYIVHIPEILYHWRSHSGSVAGNKESKGYAYDAGLRALQDTLHRNDISGEFVEDTTVRGIYRYIPEINSKKKKDSLLVFFGTEESDLLSCSCTDIAAVHLLINEKEVSQSDFRQVPSLRQGLSDVLSETPEVTRFCLIDARCQVSDSGPISTLLGHLDLPDVCGVSPKIICGDQVLMGGVSLSEGVLKNHFFNAHTDHVGYGARLCTMHNVSILSPVVFAACASLMREILREGVKDSYELALAYSQHVITQAKRLVWTPASVVAVPEAFFPVSYEFDRSEEGTPVLNVESVSSFRDLYYPVGLDIKQRNFRGVD